MNCRPMRSADAMHTLRLVKIAHFTQVKRAYRPIAHISAQSFEQSEAEPIVVRP